jgi:hypothetical protein
MSISTCRLHFPTRFFAGLVFLCLIFSRLEAASSLVVTYVTAHVNYLENCIHGVLLTPNGDEISTGTLGPFDVERIILDNPQVGTYTVYFQALTSFLPHYCYVVGGIEALLSNNPAKIIPYVPTDSRVQGFNPGNRVFSGDTTLPVASFEITQEDLE